MGERDRMELDAYAQYLEVVRELEDALRHLADEPAGSEERTRIMKTLARAEVAIQPIVNSLRERKLID